MTTPELLNTLVGRGATVHLENGDQLRIKPAAALTDELRAQIRLNKAEIVAFLTRPNPKPCSKRSARPATCAPKNLKL